MNDAAKAELGTILTYHSLLKADQMADAILSDISTDSLGDAYRGLGLTRVTFWMQRDPDASVVMWEGTDIDTVLERFASSSNPVLARWRGLLRMFSGQEEAERFWDASHHRLLSWSTGEQGAESQIAIYRDPRHVEAYRTFCLDFQHDPSLARLLDRVRRPQGFTRIETWQQQMKGDDIVLTLLEAHDLSAAMAQLMAEDNPLDKRVMDLVRSTLLEPETPMPSTNLLARWHAEDLVVTTG